MPLIETRLVRWLCQIGTRHSTWSACSTAVQDGAVADEAGDPRPIDRRERQRGADLSGRNSPVMLATRDMLGPASTVIRESP